MYLKSAISNRQILALIVTTQLTACIASQPHSVDNCGVAVFSGEPTDGLVQPYGEFLNSLLEQLPADARNKPLCWYQKPDGTLEAQTFDRAYVYQPTDGRWLFSNVEQRYLLWDAQLE